MFSIPMQSYIFQNIFQKFSFTFLLACLTLTCAIIYCYRRRKFYRCGAKMRNPPSWPIVGSARVLYRGSEQVVSDLHNYHFEFRALGDRIAAAFFGPLFLLFPMDAEPIRHTLNRILQKSDIYLVTANLFRDGVLGFSSVEKWRADRKMTAPSFQYNVLKSYVGIFFEEANILVRKFSPLMEKKESFYPGTLLNLATFNMVVRSTLGDNPKAQESEDHPVVKAMMDIMESIQERIFHPFLQNNTVSNLFGYIATEKGYEKIIRDYSRNIVRRMAKGKTSDNTVSFAAHMMKNNIPEEDLVTHIINVMFAGTDTTKTANFAALLMLGLHPNVQDKAYEEVISLVGHDKTVQPSYENLMNMHYLEMVIKEALRLFPPVPVIARQVVSDGEQLEGIEIPKGASTIVNIYTLHRDATYYPNPNAFDPDRFVVAEAAKRPIGCYVPFLIGPRDCIGRRYAMLQMKTLLSTVLRNYRILPAPSCQTMEDVRLEMRTTSRFADNCQFQLEQRDS